ncbi:T9SS type A sorting domain-containing protein [Hymenobacter sp.]|uniref:T9SS type A sorting domain-containing protein n=1 Tax=Hymenobacter sp. TaxID=1898978 RepID=UPI002EDAAE36
MQDHSPVNRLKQVVNSRPNTTARVASNPYVSAQGQNVAGTYTDLGTTGTAISTANTDDANSAAQSIGFSFTYNGAAFTQFILNTNGFIKLGAVAPTATNDTDALLNSTDANIIAPASGVDLQGAANQAASPTEYRVTTTGTPGSQVCTIQFKNVRDKATVFSNGTVDPQFATMQFQIKLYEGTNTIEFVYGTWTATANPASDQPFLIGLKGNALSSGTTITQADLRELSLLFNPGAQFWSTTTFTNVVTQGGQNYLAGHFTANDFLPDAGRTYRFRVAPPTDAAVQLVYSLGKTPTNNSQVIQAVVRNTGLSALTNVAVTLNVTGANSYTNGAIVPSLAQGASTTVSFAAFTPTAVGNNSITVTATVAGDGLASNNSQTVSQTVTANTYSAADPNRTTNDISVGLTDNSGSNAGTGILATKYSATVTRTITAVNVQLGDDDAGGVGTSVGRTVYAVVLSSTGAVLGRTPDYVIQAGDIGAYKTFTLPTPVAVAVGDFYVGLAQPASSNTAPFSPLGLQAEAPTRTGSFYILAITGGTPEDVAEYNLGRFMIEAVTTGSPQGTSAALNRAIEMYPNPASGLVKLAVQGANAKGNLSATVINQLGQVVHTARLKDNFINELDLSSLANGLYLLKVQTGNEFTIRQLVLTK